MNPKLIALACKAYKALEVVWKPVVHPNSPFVWFVDAVKNPCWYCTTARVASLGAGAALLFVGHWVTGLIAVAGVAFVVIVERVAACAPVDEDSKTP